MEQKAFKAILEKYLDNACNASEKKFVEEWFEAIGKEARNELSGDEERQLFEAYQDDFEGRFRKETALSATIGWVQWMKVAATVLVIFGSLLYLYVSSSTNIGSLDDVFTAGSSAALNTIINDRSSAYPVELKDGSRVVLNPGAVLTYSLPFNKGSREVTLEGEAFFDVPRDSLLPFVVRTGQLMTTVLGTSFTIKANKGEEDIIVTVKTGKVEVKQLHTPGGKQSSTAVLTPNEQAVCNIQRGSISRILLEEKKPVQRDTLPRYRFLQAPVADIFRALERQHSFTIVFDEADFAGCLLSTSLMSTEDLFTRLDIICRTIGATYKVDGVSVLVTGQSCGQSG